MYIIISRFYWVITFVAVLSAPVSAQKGKSFVKKAHLSIAADKKQVIASGNELPEQSITKERLVEISTDYGVMVAKLYDSTPHHRNNFIKLVEQKFYEVYCFIVLLMNL